MSPAVLVCKKIWLTHFFGEDFIFVGYEDMIPSFLLDYAASGVSLCQPQYPVVLPVADAGGKALKG